MQTEGCLKYTLQHFRWLLHIKATCPTGWKPQVSKRTQKEECKEAEARTALAPTASDSEAHTAKNTVTLPESVKQLGFNLNLSKDCERI